MKIYEGMKTNASRQQSFHVCWRKASQFIVIRNISQVFKKLKSKRNSKEIKYYEKKHYNIKDDKRYSYKYIVLKSIIFYYNSQPI